MPDIVRLTSMFFMQRVATPIQGLDIALSLSSCTSSCTARQTILPPETLFGCSITQPEPVNPDLAAQVYLDATSSMQGFAKAESASQYVLFLQEIERAFTTGWKSPQLKYW